MKYKVLLLLLVITLLGMTACDRFTRPEPETGPGVAEELATYFDTEITTALDGMTTTDVSAIMAFYSDTYLNNGVVKADVEQAYIDYMNAGNVGPFAVSLTVENESTMKVNWSFTTAKEIPQTDYLIADGDGYLFIGDQLEPPSEDKKVAIVEILTATWCPNCPELEEEIENLKSTYGDRLSFVEYHFNDGLSGDFSDIQSWYNIYSAPTGVLQGTNILVGSETNTLNQYGTLIEELTSQDAEITLKDFSFTLTGDQYDFQIELANPGLVSAENLYLRYMLIEETSAALNNAGHPCKNVMLEQAKIALSEEDIAGTFTFNHTVSETVPDDTSIILFIQTMPDVYDDQTSVIHNVLEAPLY